MNNIIKFTTLHSNEICTQWYQRVEPGTYIAYWRGKRCATEDDFFHEVSASFQFPWYFGENWSALDECLCDLEWLSFSKILIVVDDFHLIFWKQFKIQKLLQDRVVRYLECMVTYWNSEGKSVEVWLNN